MWCWLIMQSEELEINIEDEAAQGKPGIAGFFLQ